MLSDMLCHPLGYSFPLVHLVASVLECQERSKQDVGDGVLGTGVAATGEEVGASVATGLSVGNGEGTGVLHTSS